DALEGGQTLLERFHLVLDGTSLACEEIRDGLGKAGVADPVSAVGRARQIAALDLVLALRASFDPLQAARDGEVDRAVVADFEMQEGEIALAAPIAAIKRVRTDQVERACDISLALPRQHQDDPVRHALAQQGEEGTVEIGRAPLPV